MKLYTKRSDLCNKTQNKIKSYQLQNKQGQKIQLRLGMANYSTNGQKKFKYKVKKKKIKAHLQPRKLGIRCKHVFV